MFRGQAIFDAKNGCVDFCSNHAAISVICLEAAGDKAATMNINEERDVVKLISSIRADAYGPPILSLYLQFLYTQSLLWLNGQSISVH